MGSGHVKPEEEAAILEVSALQESAGISQPQAEGTSGQDPVMRPGTPDAAAEKYGSQASLSASDDQCNSPQLTDTVESSAMFLSATSGEGCASDPGSEEAESCSASASRPTVYHLGQRPPSSWQAGKHSSCTQLKSGHQRHASEASLAASESSVGTVIDKSGGLDKALTLAKAADSGAPQASASPTSDSGEVHVQSKTEEEDAEPDMPTSAFSKGGPQPSSELGSESKQSQLACNTCNVVATSEGQLASHLEGKKHQRFLAMAQLEDGATIERNHSSNLEEDLHCNLCDVTAPSAHHREYHLRGQKHQRREKQQWLMEASAQLASSSVNALLTEEEEGQGDTAASAASAVSATDIGGKPMRSPFEAFDPSRPLPAATVITPTHQRLSSKMVRFSGNLESFSEHAGEDGALNMQLSRAPSLPNVLSTGSFKLVSGGSFSSPAAHYCPVCGIIATSEANLQDHLRGRRHARRLQYLSHMPEDERKDQLQRTVTGGSGVFRQGSLVLPSSMDLTAYIGRVAQVHPQTPTVAAIERAASLSRNKSLSSQQLSWDSTNGLHLHMDPDTASQEASAETAGEPKSKIAEVSETDEGTEEDSGPKIQPRCEICGITTTSQAHMEAHMAGRKHRRRVEAATGQGHLQQSPHYCALCDISTTSAAHLSLHLVGRAHRRRQKAIENGEFPMPLSQTAVLAKQPRSSSADRPLPVSDAARQCSGEATRSTGDKDLGSSEVEGSIHEYSPVRPNATGRRQERGFQEVRGLQAVEPAAQHQAPLPVPWHHMRPVAGRSPSSHAQGPFPMGMLPYPPPFYSAAPMPQFIPGTGHTPMYGWWPAPPVDPSHGYHKPPFQQPGHMHYPPPYAAAPAPYGMAMPSYSRPPARAHPSRGPRGQPDPTLQAGWPQPQQEPYNCEVCNVQTEKLDDLKQHLRGKPHLRRLHNSASEAGRN